MIYFDYAANCPADPQVLKTFNDTTLQYFANPNASHKLGYDAKDALDASNHHICELLGIKDDEIIYTSGATESNNLAVKGILERYRNKGRHVIVGSLEHSSLLSAATYKGQTGGYEIEVAPLDQYGRIDLEELEDMIQDDTILVSVCAVDSELGIVQPIQEIAELLKDYPDCFFHVDASQAIGKITLPVNDIDLMTLTPHKFYGLNGCGALVKKEGIHLIPQIHGGKSTTVYRSGTPNLAMITAFDTALTIALDKQEERYTKVQEIHDIILNKLKTYKQIHINTTKYSLPYYINFSLKNVKSDTLVEALEKHEIYVSAKTSCCPDSAPSKLVLALYHDKSLASSSIRLSLSHLSTEEEALEFLKVFDETYKELEND